MGRGNQDGGIGRHTAPPCTTRTDRKSNGKEVRHQVHKKETYIQTCRRGGDGHPGQRGLMLLWRVRDWRSVGRTGQAVQPLADPAAPHSHTDKPRGPDLEWRRMGQAERQVADPVAPHSCIDKPGQTAGTRAPTLGDKASNL